MCNFTDNEIMKKMFVILLLMMAAPVVLRGLETSPVGIALIQKFEGLRLKAYRCPANVWTIGYGNTKFAKPGKRITRDQARAYLKYDINRFEKYITRTIPRKLRWYENDALVSFCFNLGYRLKGRLKTAIITRNTALAVYKLRLYVKARVRGVLKELRGLVRRRNDEANLYQGFFYRLDFFNEKHLTTEQMREAVWRYD
jgi:lysozyme